MSFLAGWDLETVCSADGSMFSELNEIIRYVERLQGSIATWLVSFVFASFTCFGEVSIRMRKTTL